MQPATFQYHRPSTLEEALDLLGDEAARPLAGGHSLLPMMKLRVATPETLVDIGRIPGLSGIEREGDTLRVGALTTHAEVAASATVREHCAVLAETAGMIGDLQVRNMGTIGGSLAHADPAADYPAVILALEGSVTARGPGGERQIAVDELLVDMFTTSLEPGELITSVSVPVLGDGRAGAYLKHRHPASSYAVVGVAAVLTVQGGSCSDVRLVIGGASGRPVRATAAEQALEGQAPSEESFAEAAGHVAEAIEQPVGDVYASEEYRVHLATVLAERALARAAERAG